MNTAPHRWTFFRAGGFNQVALTTGADLLHLDELDQKLWVALACPTSGLEFDRTTLGLIETDKDGRVRAPELIASFARQVLGNTDNAERLEALNAIDRALLAAQSPEHMSEHEDRRALDARRRAVRARSAP